MHVYPHTTWAWEHESSEIVGRRPAMVTCDNLLLSDKPLQSLNFQGRQNGIGSKIYPFLQILVDTIIFWLMRALEPIDPPS